MQKIRWSFVNYVKLLLPMIMGYLATNICLNRKNSKSAGASVSFRPPPYVFAIIWPILFILLGLSWVVSTSGTVKTHVNLTNGSFLLITLLLSLWAVVYDCLKNKIGGVYVLASSIGAVVLAMNLIPLEARLMLVPLLTWLLLALLLNAFEVY